MTPTSLPGDGLDGPARDRALLAAHVDGDPDAFGELVRLHQGRLWAVALRTLGNPEDAADALQEALLSAFRSASGYRGEAAVTTWLHRVVVNACLDRMRRSRARPTVPLPDLDAADRASTSGGIGGFGATGDDQLAVDTRIDVTAALARLPEHQRLALVLVDLQDLPVAEVADVLGVAEGTVKSRCARGRAALAALLRSADEQPGNRTRRADVPGPGHPARSTAPPHREAAPHPQDAPHPQEGDQP